MLGQNFLNIFAKSPIKPIQQHMHKIYQCVSCLNQFFVEINNENWDKAREIQKQIMDMEEEADELKKSVRLHVPSSLFMPVERTDLLTLITTQDKIAGKAKHIASVVLGRKMFFPNEIREQFGQFLEKSILVCKKARNAINELDELVETGFKGKVVKVVENMVVELDEIENQTDDLQVKVRQNLFSIEKELNPIDAIFLYKVIDWTAELADGAQIVGHRLETLLAQ